MKQSKEVIQSWLDALDNPRHELTKWEEEFLDNTAEQFAVSSRISDRQEEILERIYSEKT